MNVILLSGPVFPSTLDSVRWIGPAPKIIVMNQGLGGIGSSHFAALMKSLGPRPLTAILEKNGVPNPNKVSLVGFSAAHGGFEVILTSPDASRVSALMAMDAYFTSHEGKTIPKPGYLALAKRAAAGNALMVATTSAFGGVTPPYPPGDESFAFLAAKIPGVKPKAPPPGVPAPVSCVGTGLFTWADYKTTFQHAEHANILASKWCSSVLSPYLAGQLASPQVGSRAENAAWGGLLLLGVVAAGVKVLRAA